MRWTRGRPRRLGKGRRAHKTTEGGRRLEASLDTGDDTRRLLDVLLHEALDSNERSGIAAVSNEKKVQHA